MQVMRQRGGVPIINQSGASRDPPGHWTLLSGTKGPAADYHHYQSSSKYSEVVQSDYPLMPDTTVLVVMPVFWGQGSKTF